MIKVLPYPPPSDFLREVEEELSAKAKDDGVVAAGVDGERVAVVGDVGVGCGVDADADDTVVVVLWLLIVWMR